MRLSAPETVNTNLTTPVTMPYKALRDHGLRLHGGQTSLWVAAPGVGKSMFLANGAIRGGDTCMYFSADTSRRDIRYRVLAMLTGYTISQCEEFEGSPSFDAAAILARADHVEWIFDGTLTDQLVTDRLKAYVEIHGQFPKWVVVDNLSNAVTNTEYESNELRQLTRDMQKLAKITGAHIAQLHHAGGAYENGDRPIPQGGILYNLAKIPEVVVSMHHKGTDQLGVNILKNRSGKPDPSAQSAFGLLRDYSKASVYGYDS